MKILAFLLIVSASLTFAQSPSKSRLTVFYFGGSDCAHSTDDKNIANINKIRSEFASVHKETSVKFVMVVMDENIDEGIQFMKKHTQWDEVSIGQFYDNELMVEHVNGTPIPGVPHLMVYKDSLVRAEKVNVPLLTGRTLLVDLVGVSAIEKWISNGYSIKK